MSFQYTIEVTNGLSDFHKMVITVMKMSFKKQRKAIVRMSQLDLRQNILKLKLKPTSNYVGNIKKFVVKYTKGKEENIMSP